MCSICTCTPRLSFLHLLFSFLEYTFTVGTIISHVIWSSELCFSDCLLPDTLEFVKVTQKMGYWGGVHKQNPLDLL